MKPNETQTINVNLSFQWINKLFTLIFSTMVWLNGKAKLIHDKFRFFFFVQKHYRELTHELIKEIFDWFETIESRRRLDNKSRAQHNLLDTKMKHDRKVHKPENIFMIFYHVSLTWEQIVLSSGIQDNEAYKLKVLTKKHAFTHLICPCPCNTN